MAHTHNFSAINGTNSTTVDIVPTISPIVHLSLLAVPLHISHIVMVIMKKNLHNNLYAILVNLSISDLLYVAGVNVSVFLQVKRRVGFTIVMTFYLSSVLFTIAMALDRYIKVKYGLHYYRVMTNKRKIMGLIAIWICPIIVFVLPTVIVDDVLHMVIVTRSFLILCCFLLIGISLWVQHVRNGHSDAILRLNRHFGVHQEELDHLNKLKRGIKEIMQLSFLTAGFVIVSSVIQIVNALGIEDIYLMRVRIACTQLYVITNPFVYLLIMRDLRRHYFRAIMQVQVQPAQPSTLNNTPHEAIELE